ncbi:MAG: CvpA family protein, partial [Nitrospinaceae bacterium]|nr:CvpA family protein [Nitrospinaceae bacterium]
VLSVPDRILGGVLGFAKGLVIIAVIMFPLSLFEDSYKKATQGSVLAPYLEQIANFVSQEVHERNLLDKFPKVSIDDVKKKIKELSDLKKLSEDMKAKKDEIMKSVQDKVKTESKEQTQEQYTDEDKTKLKDILKTF